MDEISRVVAESFTPDIHKCVLSAPVPGGEYRRASLRLYAGGYQIERLTATQAFHENTDFAGAAGYLANTLGREFKQANMWGGGLEICLKISKKGKLLASRRKAAGPTPENVSGHNREKSYLLDQGAAIGPLRDMGVLTEDGRVVRSMYGKYKQINRFIEILDDEVKKLDVKKTLNIIDFGCGKSYLTFIMYHYFTEIRGLGVKMTGLDLKADVVEKCSAAAEKYGYANLKFVAGDIEGYNPGENADIVVSLHACDTATDHALFGAICRNAELIFCAPCCQHEINGQIRSERLPALTRYGVVKERFSSLLTDTIRALLLEHLGYKTQILEFVDFEHTPKNIMLRAVKKNASASDRALSEAEALISEFKLDPALYRLLRDNGMIRSA